MKPFVTGCSGSPPRRTRRPSSTVAIRPQASGQSRLQTVRWVSTAMARILPAPDSVQEGALVEAPTMRAGRLVERDRLARAEDRAADRVLEVREPAVEDEVRPVGAEVQDLHEDL